MPQAHPSSALHLSSDADSIAEFDFAELDEAVSRRRKHSIAKPVVYTPSAVGQKPGLIQRLLSHLSAGFNTVRATKSGPLEEQGQERIACRICEQQIAAEQFNEHTEQCAAMAECSDERSRTDAFLLRLLDYHQTSSRYTDSSIVRKIAEAALAEPSNEHHQQLKSAIVILAKLQYRLTKARVRHRADDLQFLHNQERLSYLIEHKRGLLERQQTLLSSASSSNEMHSASSLDDRSSQPTPNIINGQEIGTLKKEGGGGGPLTHLVQSLLGSRKKPSSKMPGTNSPSRSSSSPRAAGHYLAAPKLTDFDLLKPLGRGGYGSVFLARGKRTGDLFAIKAVRKSETHKKNSLAHALTERRALSLIRSPWVVSLFYAFQSESMLFLVEEYMIGGDLGTLLRVHKRFSCQVVRFYCAELVAAITLLHSTAGIVHHDLKPGNILIGADGHIKLIDLGLAKLDSVLDQPHVAGKRPMYAGKDDMDTGPIGTPDYMAPEIINGEYECGRPVDLWALGCIVYELFTGRPPFHDTAPGAIFEKICAGAVDYRMFSADPLELDEHGQLRGMIEGLLSQDPSKRPTADEIKDDPFFSTINWATLRESLEPPFVPKPLSDDDTVYFELAQGGGKPGLLADLQEARPLLIPDSVSTTSPSQLLMMSSPGSGLSTSLSGNSSLSSSPFDSTFAFRNIDLLESVNRRLGQQLRQSGASSPLRRP